MRASVTLSYYRSFALKNLSINHVQNTRAREYKNKIRKYTEEESKNRVSMERNTAGTKTRSSDCLASSYSSVIHSVAVATPRNIHSKIKMRETNMSRCVKGLYSYRTYICESSNIVYNNLDSYMELANPRILLLQFHLKYIINTVGI